VEAFGRNDHLCLLDLFDQEQFFVQGVSPLLLLSESNQNTSRFKKRINILKIETLSRVKRPEQIRHFSFQISDRFRKVKAEAKRLVQKIALGQIGRASINDRFYQKLPLSLEIIIVTDFIAARLKLNHLCLGKRFDDIDTLSIRVLYFIGDLIQKEIKNITL
jgi:hypothetical protein